MLTSRPFSIARRAVLGIPCAALCAAAVLCAVAALPPASAAADTLALAPDRDNTLFEDAAGSLSNGAGDRLFAGRSDQGSGSRRRALVRFDVSTVPAGATVTSARLSFNVSRSRGSDNRTISIHRLTAGWGEGSSNASGQEGRGASSTSGDATWQHRSFPNQTWSTSGGDFAGTASATVAVGGTGPYAVASTAALVADVQRWIDTPNSNAGWIFIGNESTTRTAKRIDSRESGMGVMLTIDYDVAPPAELLCRESRVHAGAGSPEDTLLVNGTAGDSQHIVSLGAGAPFTVSISPSSSGPNPGPFVMYLHLGEPDASTVTTIPQGLGLFCFGTPITGGSAHKIWNNIGRRGRIGHPDFPSSPAPSIPVNAPRGAPSGITVTLQAVLLDNGSSASAPASITNAVILKIQ